MTKIYSYTYIEIEEEVSQNHFRDLAEVVCFYQLNIAESNKRSQLILQEQFTDKDNRRKKLLCAVMRIYQWMGEKNNNLKCFY